MDLLPSLDANFPAVDLATNPIRCFAFLTLPKHLDLVDVKRRLTRETPSGVCLFRFGAAHCSDRVLLTLVECSDASFPPSSSQTTPLVPAVTTDLQRGLDHNYRRFGITR